MISLEMTKEDANILLSVIENYTYHLTVEIAHTDRKNYRDALKRREIFLKNLIDTFKAKIATGV